MLRRLVPGADLQESGHAKRGTPVRQKVRQRALKYILVGVGSCTGVDREGRIRSRGDAFVSQSREREEEGRVPARTTHSSILFFHESRKPLQAEVYYNHTFKMASSSASLGGSRNIMRHASVASTVQAETAR